MKKQPIERSALLVIDAQDSFKVGSRWDRRSNPDFDRNVSALIDAWREAGLPVIFVLHTDDGPGFRRDSPEFRLMDFIERRDSEPLLIKNTRNAFTSTDLQQRLEARGVTRVVVTGIQTEQCCETTTRLAADLGYDADFVTEATMSFPIVNAETGEELSTNDVIHRTEFVLRDRFARIARVADLVDEVKGALVSSAR
ncbi:MAG: AraC family transcriptional regulator [Acidobacteria bacterium]|nr:AraC family transcriptional regulator [Acidobacteriota bacterium]